MPNNEIMAVPANNAMRGIDFFNPHSFEMAQRACKGLVNSELVPPMYSSAKVGAEKAVANAIIALDMSARTGASPLMIMQNLYVVQGRPSFSSAFLISTINTCGRYDTLKYEMGVLDGGVKDKNKNVIPGLVNMYCYAYTWEKGQTFMSEDDKKKQCLKSTMITMQMAVDEGWMDKPGSKWKTMPSQMLKYRAAAFWCRAFAPELSMGMHTTEEITDGMVEDVEFVESKPSANDGLGGIADKIIAKNKEKAEQAKAMQEAGDSFADATGV